MPATTTRRYGNWRSWSCANWTPRLQAAGPLAPLLLRWFDLQLLSVTGFQPQFFHCLGCASDLEAVLNFLSLAEGGVFCPNCGAQRHDVEPIQPDVLKVLRFLQSRPWSEVQPLQPRPAVLQGVDQVLQRFISSVVERHLRTPEFLRRLEMMRRTGYEAPRLVADGVG